MLIRTEVFTVILPSKTHCGMRFLRRPAMFITGMPSRPTFRNRHISKTSTMQSASWVNIRGARPLAIFGDSVTTDHISPAGAIKASSPAGLYLQAKGVAIEDFNSYGSRRGNHRGNAAGYFCKCAHQKPHGARCGRWSDDSSAEWRANEYL